MSTFQDELYRNIKTPEQINKEQKELIIAQAELDYECIKHELMSKAKSGDYSKVNGKTYIYTNYNSMYLPDYILRDNQTTRRKKILFSGYDVNTNITYSIKNQEEYDLFLKTIRELAKEDDIEIEPIFLSVEFTNKQPITLPFTYRGQYSIAHKVEVYLLCGIEI